MLLSSAIAKEIENLNGKLKFYSFDQPDKQTLYQSENSLTLEQTLSLIDPNDPDLQADPNLSLLYGLTWEFIWGKPAPKWVTDLRESTAVKARYALPLNEIETLWNQLMLTDTDWF